jgi:hypothetical protein
MNYMRIIKYLARSFAVSILLSLFLQTYGGYSAYGAISVALGLTALYWADFELNWRNVSVCC